MDNITMVISVSITMVIIYGIISPRSIWAHGRKAIKNSLKRIWKGFMMKTSKPYHAGTIETGDRMDKNMFDWIESHAINNLKGRAENARLIAKEAQFTVNMLMAGGGASLGFTAVRMGTDSAEVLAAAMAVSIYMFSIAAYLLLRCLKFEDFPAVYNEPDNLILPGWPHDAIRDGELLRLQASIKLAVKINLGKSNRLNRAQVAITLTPLIGIFAWLAVKFTEAERVLGFLYRVLGV
ncbi:hypothetical protein ACW4YW_15185 [Methylobacillus pratensis]